MSDLNPYEEGLALELQAAQKRIEALIEQLDAARKDADEAEAYAWELEQRLGAALEPAPTDAAHVNETLKSEHDAGNVLTAAQAREAALEVPEVKALVEAARSLMKAFPEDCYFDHHGCCQAHFIEDDCSVELTKSALRRIAEGEA